QQYPVGKAVGGGDEAMVGFEEGMGVAQPTLNDVHVDQDGQAGRKSGRPNVFFAGGSESTSGLSLGFADPAGSEFDVGAKQGGHGGATSAALSPGLLRC